MTMRTLLLSTLLIVGLLLPMLACSSTDSSANENELAANVGNYPPPPANAPAVPPKVGVPPFLVQDVSGADSDQMSSLAADQLTTLAFDSDRFIVIERAQVEQLLREQNMQGVVREDQLAQAGQVLGVDMLFIGKITNYRVQTTESNTDFSVARVRGPFGSGVGALGISNSDTEITVDCGVDLRLVDPQTGVLFAAGSAEYQRTDTAGAFGLAILGADADADTQMSVDEDNHGLILRLALDHCLRQLIEEGKLDRGISRWAAMQDAAQE